VQQTSASWNCETSSHMWIWLQRSQLWQCQLPRLPKSWLQLVRKRRTRSLKSVPARPKSRPGQEGVERRRRRPIKGDHRIWLRITVNSSRVTSWLMRPIYSIHTVSVWVGGLIATSRYFFTHCTLSSFSDTETDEQTSDAPFIAQRICGVRRVVMFRAGLHVFFCFFLPARRSKRAERV